LILVFTQKGELEMNTTNGLCECGCGQSTPIANKTDPRRSWVKGQAHRFIQGHNSRVRRVRSGPFKHGHWLAHPVEYQAFQDAKKRCTNPRNKRWADYGGRGIKFLFTSFEQFFAELGPKTSPEHSLDRFPNNDGNYELGNVRWATPLQQRLNQRERKTAA
jgi:hypothetical protein